MKEFWKLFINDADFFINVIGGAFAVVVLFTSLVFLLTQLVKENNNRGGY